MASSFLPIRLSGNNLGQRHRFLNSQVNHAVTGQLSFEHIEALPELSAADRLFKIDVANKLQHVDYILNNLKDDDMLYVSRSLRCKWLINRRDLINPKYLETELFPNMIMPAISKMRHWLYINLRDTQRCQEFYQYYKDTKFDFAVKFLYHCDYTFVGDEFPQVLLKITPHYLKMLSENCHIVAKMYYDALATNNILVKQHLREERYYFDSIKGILKFEPDVFLDITEKYHPRRNRNRLSSNATNYVLRYHKDRFMAKCELYVLHILDIPTIAQRLSVEECQEVVLKLARADYLNYWFSYEVVEPFIKRVGQKDRAAFKKLVFVEKNVGDRVAEWPYSLPASPVDTDVNSDQSYVFCDRKYDPINIQRQFGLKRRVMKRCGNKFEDCAIVTVAQPKSELQILFDEFRFVGFEGTLFELKDRLGAVSSADRRRDILLVLVSKSGGRPESVHALLQVALRLRNEPVHERATVVRSLARRACMWRLPQDVWDEMLEYAQGLGLDGIESEANCREGLHAVVLRQLLTRSDCEPAVRKIFLEHFSTLTEYKLTAKEREAIAAGLQNMLVTAAADADTETAANRLHQLLDVLKQYRIGYKSSSVLSAVATLAESDFEAARPLLERLYQARAGRRELFHHYLQLRNNDASLINVLRHDPSALKAEWLVDLLHAGNTKADRFLSKIVVYFNEVGGIAEQVRLALQNKLTEGPEIKLARSLAALSTDVASMWHEQDAAGGEHYKLAAALRASMHRARPAPNALTIGWKEAGMKAVAWRAMRCRPAQVTKLVQDLLKERVRRTVRLAVVLALRTNAVEDFFATAMEIRPLSVLRATLPYYRIFGDSAGRRIWDMVKSTILNVDLNTREGLRHVLKKVDWVPNSIKPDYYSVLYLALDAISARNTDRYLCDIITLLPEVSGDLLEKVQLRILENMGKEKPVSYPAFVVRYLMLSQDETELKTRLQKVGIPMLETLYTFRQHKEGSRRAFFQENMDQLVISLQYNYAFFDTKYQSLPVIEHILAWLIKPTPKETYFKQYIKIHATMLYFKAIRQSLNQKPLVFKDSVLKATTGVEIVGYIFGRYIVKELTVLMNEYFESVIEFYHIAFTEYLQEYFTAGPSRAKFIVSIIEGILAGSVGSEARLAVHVLKECQNSLNDSVTEEMRATLMKIEDKETQFFLHAEIFA